MMMAYYVIILHVKLCFSYTLFYGLIKNYNNIMCALKAYSFSFSIAALYYQHYQNMETCDSWEFDFVCDLYNTIIYILITLFYETNES